MMHQQNEARRAKSQPGALVSGQQEEEEEEEEEEAVLAALGSETRQIRFCSSTWYCHHLRQLPTNTTRTLLSFFTQYETKQQLQTEFYESKETEALHQRKAFPLFCFRLF